MSGIYTDISTEMKTGIVQNPSGFFSLLNSLIGFYKLKNELNKIWADYVAFHSKLVVSLDTVTFFTDVTDSNQISVDRPQGEHFIITAIKFLEGANASVPATAWTEGMSTADMKNGQFDININGVDVLEDMPNSRSVEADEDVASGFMALKIPLVWGGQQQLKLPVAFAVAPATANQNMRIELYGFALI